MLEDMSSDRRLEELCVLWKPISHLQGLSHRSFEAVANSSVVPEARLETLEKLFVYVGAAGDSHWSGERMCVLGADGYITHEPVGVNGEGLELRRRSRQRASDKGHHLLSRLIVRQSDDSRAAWITLIPLDCKQDVNRLDHT